MSSPDVFRSSPHRASRSQQRSVTVEHQSSSPGLPNIEDLLSQKPPRPPIRSGSRAQSIPEGAASAFTSAREHWKSAQAAADQDDSVVVIEAPEAPDPKKRKPRRAESTAGEQRLAAAGARNAIEQSKTDEEPWKKYIPSPPKSKTTAEQTAEKGRDEVSEKPQTTKKKATKKTGTMSKHFQSGQELPKKEQRKVDPEHPLELEQAMDRRTDWTPPDTKKVGVLDVNSSAANNPGGVAFKTLLQSYSCNDQPQQGAISISEEDSSFLKKRKLIEPISPARGSRSASPEKSPTKQKAPKKKARTITDLATAAYRPAVLEEPAAPPPGSVLDHFPEGRAEANEGDGKAGSKTKPKARKKPAKPSKKKAVPPKPVLLSPATALTEVSKQDFVFGTSSQLVREQSPTMLRDLQAAIRNSTQANVDPFSDPFNSDPVEPPEIKRKLWEAGARDDEGQLFHAALINLVDSSPEILPKEEDPFGYYKPDELPSVIESEPSAEGPSFETLPDALPAFAQQTKPKKAPNQRTVEVESHLEEEVVEAEVDDASFVNLSDILSPDVKTATEKPPVIIDENSPFSSSQISVSSDVRRERGATSTSPLKTQGTQTLTAPSEVTSPSSVPTASSKQPNFDLYTDTQLSREITTYGFKPIKKRTTMISLLQQCWQSKHPAAPVGARPFTTSATQAKQQAEVSPKRPRGRPRKNSISEIEALDPPPSGQAAESPKRPRGRPQKDANSEDPKSRKRPGRPKKDKASSARPASPAKTAKKDTKGAKATKAAKVPAAGPVKTSSRKSKPSPTPIEIPDSASDDAGIMSASPASSPEPMFSPSQSQQDVDLTVSMEDEADQSLLLNPDEEEAALFKRIAKAVTTSPPTTDPANPSWYEKILMYDPIVLEDITAWLNSGQLTKVGYDGEVKPGDVKKWCESESVCCLWRVNLRGKERKRV